MKLLIASVLLVLLFGCAAKSPHKKNQYIFIGVHNGVCEVDDSKTHWDAKTGALVLTCKPEVKR